MEIYNRLNDLKREALLVIREMTVFMQELYPLNNVRFMNSDEKQKYEEFHKRIEKINEDYNNLYMRLSINEKMNHNHLDVMGKFMQAVHSYPSLHIPNSDNKETNINNIKRIVRTILRRKITAEERSDIETINKCNRIIDGLRDIITEYMDVNQFDIYVSGYEERLRSGRTDDDDIKEYNELIEETRLFAIEYAKALIDGLSVEGNDLYVKSFDDYIEKGKTLLEFLTPAELSHLNTEGDRIAATCH